MQISDFLWQRARPETSRRGAKRRRRPHKNKSGISSRQTDSAQPVVSSNNTAGFRAVSDQSATPNPTPKTPVTPPRKARLIRVRVDYRNADTGERIASPKIIRGHVGDRLSLNYPQLTDWVFNRVVNYQPFFPARRKTIVLYYSRIVGAPVIVYHRDQDGQLLSPPERLFGKLDAEFTAKCLSYFSSLNESEPTVSGQFTRRVQTITFRYKVLPITPIQLPNVAYIELLADKFVFSTPAGTEPLPVKLPIGTFWRVFDAVQTQTDQQVWLSLGGAQWLTNTDTRPHQQNPYIR